jgi:hypothetical protein
MNSVLGWYDALRFASKSGRQEIFQNQSFMSRAYLLGGRQKYQQAIKFISDNPDQMRPLVERGIGLAEEYRNTASYDHQWVAAVGLDRVIGTEAAIASLPKGQWDQAWEDAKTKVRQFYGMEAVAAAEGNAQAAPIGSPHEIRVEPQPWETRRNAFFATVREAQAGYPNAEKEYDAILTGFEQNAMSRTPMENMDILGVFYVPKEGVEKCLSIVAMNAVLGWYDALRFGSVSGREEIFLNQKFLWRAFILGGEEKQGQAIRFLSENPEKARALVEQGIGFAEKYRNGQNYDHQWVTAFGLERMIAAQGHKSQPIPAMPEKQWNQAWEDAKAGVLSAYVKK